MTAAVILAAAAVACTASGHRTLALFAGIVAIASLIVTGWNEWRPGWARREYARQAREAAGKQAHAA